MGERNTIMAKKDQAVKMSGESMNSQENRLEWMKKNLPEVFSEGKIDIEKLKATLGEDVDLSNERYGISWAGKSNVFREIQTPTIKTLRPDKKESVDFENTDNLFIEGDNLEVLKALQKSYYGQVKMIYIDPPYNTGKDFIYTDKWARTKAEEAAENGDVDETGKATRRDNLMVNDKSKGHFHSNWLNMMYPRLFLARNLLKDDGVIFVSIDDNEVHNLRMIMNEIFGEENFVSEIVWEKRFTRSNNAKMFATLTERVLLYRKSEVTETLREPRNEKADSTYSNPDNDPRGVWTSVSYVNPASKDARPNLSYALINPFSKQEVVHPTNAWKFSLETHNKHVEEDRLYWGKSGGNIYPRLKKFLIEMDGGMVPVDLWDHKSTGTTDQASKDLGELMEEKLFDFPKPIGLILRMLRIAVMSDDIILDFFAGSGTTAHAVMQLNAEDGGNRKCISVQLAEETSEKSEAFKAGYKTISDIAKERIRRAGKKILEENKEELAKREVPLDVGFKVLKLSESNFKEWRVRTDDPEVVQTEMELSVNNKSEAFTEEGMLYELILKSGLPLTVAIEKKEGYYKLGEGKLIISLAEKMTNEIFTSILKEKPEKIVMLDTAFTGDDQLKTNLLLQAEDGGVEDVLVV